MEHKKVNFLHSVRLKMLLAMAFFAFVTGGFACALFISSTKEEMSANCHSILHHYPKPLPDSLLIAPPLSMLNRNLRIYCTITTIIFKQ